MIEIWCILEGNRGPGFIEKRHLNAQFRYEEVSRVTTMAVRQWGFAKIDENWFLDGVRDGYLRDFLTFHCKFKAWQFQ